MKTPARIARARAACRVVAVAIAALVDLASGPLAAQNAKGPNLDGLIGVPPATSTSQLNLPTQELLEGAAANARLKEALMHFQAGEYAQAVAKAEAVTKADANSATAFQLLGVSKLKLGDFDAGMSALLNAARLFPESIGTLGAIANAYLAHGDLEKARKYFRLVLDKKSDHPTGHEGLGIVSEREGKFDEAVSHFETRIKSMAPTDLGIKVNLAGLYNRRREFNKTLALLSTAPAVTPVNASAVEMVAIAFLGLGNAAESVRYYTIAYGASPSAPIALGLGIAYRQSNQLPDSLKYLKEATAAKSNWAPGWVQLAETQIEMGDLPGALTSLEKARAFSTEKRPVLLRMGDVHLLAKDYAKALGVFEALAASRDIDLPLVERLATTYQAKGDTAAAERIYKDAVQRFPTSALPSYKLGLLYSNSGRHSEAAAEFSRATLVEPDNLALQTSLSSAFLKAGDNRHALEVAERMVQQQPASLEAKFALASLCSQTGDDRRAADIYREVLKQSPNHVIGLNNLAMILGRTGEFAEAVRLAERAVAALPKSGQLLDTLGWIKYLQADYSAAVTTLKKASELSPADASILYHLGMAYAKKNEKAAALQAFKSAVSLSKVFAEYQQTTEMIASLGGGS